MKCRTSEPDRDASLVYVRGLMDPDAYCLLAFLYPNAHELANEEPFMLWLARLAKQFRKDN